MRKLYNIVSFLTKTTFDFYNDMCICVRIIKVLVMPYDVGFRLRKF